MEIVIHPIQTELEDEDILDLFADSISREFTSSNVTIGPTLEFNIHGLIDKPRNQIRSPDLLNRILNKIQPTRSKKILVICNIDAYSVI
ncbi:MAG TPA: hypothetical protein VLA74_05720 [Nitrososphaeraceae archaeon]|nr:hypothetical protein [Nitrososphaeraceae archaeon]